MSVIGALVSLATWGAPSIASVGGVRAIRKVESADFENVHDVLFNTVHHFHRNARSLQGSCEAQHGSTSTNWLNKAGALCECINGEAVCGPVADRGIHFTPLAAGFFAAACFVLTCVLMGTCAIMYYKRKAARSLPIGGQRRSLIYTSKPDYVTTSRPSRGNHEVLPAQLMTELAHTHATCVGPPLRLC